jgi:hypothetical protein
VSFSYDNRWLVSVGGADHAVCQWMLEAKAQDERQLCARVAFANKPTVLAPEPHAAFELTHVDFAADGTELALLQEQTLREPAPADMPRVETWQVSLQVVTSDVKYAAAAQEPRHCCTSGDNEWILDASGPVGDAERGAIMLDCSAQRHH